MGLLKILITILILLFPLGELGRISIYNDISITINDLLAGLVFFAWLIWLISCNKYSAVSKNRLSKPILLFISIAFLSLLFNYSNLKTHEFVISFLYLLRFASYAGIYFVISGFDLRFKRKILILLIISGVLVVLSGFIQYFFYPSLKNLFYLGWDDHMFRMFSTFLDPNFAGSFFVLYLIILLGILFQALNKKNMVLIIFIGVLSVLTLVSIYLTFSRSALIMLFISISAFAALTKKIKLINVIVLISIVFFAISSRSYHIENINLFRIVSTEARIDSAKNAIQIIKDSPVLGIGFNAYRYAQIRYNFRHGEGAIRSHADAGTDNSFLFVLATTGIVGFTVYLYMWYRILNASVRIVAIGSISKESLRATIRGDVKEESFRKMMSIIILASTAGLFFNASFINSLFYPFLMEWMWILIGLNSSTGHSTASSNRIG